MMPSNPPRRARAIAIAATRDADIRRAATILTGCVMAAAFGVWIASLFV